MSQTTSASGEERGLSVVVYLFLPSHFPLPRLSASPPLCPVPVALSYDEPVHRQFSSRSQPAPASASLPSSSLSTLPASQPGSRTPARGSRGGMHPWGRACLPVHFTCLVYSFALLSVSPHPSMLHQPQPSNIIPPSRHRHSKRKQTYLNLDLSL
ncbi:hypothetical protein LY78DRAFT_663581 [Colletotrichum sublineola]|nr:hypothetical protein LY78DRAFT_663581 [Colletotrichum sublineola]